MSARDDLYRALMRGIPGIGPHHDERNDLIDRYAYELISQLIPPIYNNCHCTACTRCKEDE